MQHFPGEVWFLPPELRAQGDPKSRRHLLLTKCDDADDATATFAFASTQPTDANFGAVHYLLDPAATNYGRAGNCGFVLPSYIYLSRLVAAHVSDMREMMGRIIDEMGEIRSRLRLALGIGQGTAAASGPAAGSWRGCVVEMAQAYVVETGCRFAIVVTEPAYSHAQRFQTILPVYDGQEFDPEPREDIFVGDAAWLDVIGYRPGGAIIAVQQVQSVFQPDEIVRWTGAVVEEATMAEVDQFLLSIFGL